MKRYIVAYDGGEPTKEQKTRNIAGAFRRKAAALQTLPAAVALCAAVFALHTYTVQGTETADAGTSGVSAVTAVQTETRSEADNLLATVNIQVYSGTDSCKTGTGVIAADGKNGLYIVTAHHVVKGGPNAYAVRFSDGSSVAASLIYEAADADWAVLNIPAASVPQSAAYAVAVPETLALKKGASLYCYRNHYADGITEYRGTVGEVSDFSIGNVAEDAVFTTGNFIVSDFEVGYGTSGGAVFDKYGRVVGICSQAGSGKSYFVPYGKIAAFIEAACGEN